MKPSRILIAALLFVALAVGTAGAELYLEAYFGNAFTVTVPNPIDLNINPAFRGPVSADLEYPQTVSSNFILGGKVGTWFVK